MISENLSLIAQKRNELADRLQKTRTYLVSDQVKIIFDWIMEQMGYTYLYGQYKKENKMTYTYDDIVTAKDILTGKVKKEDIIGKEGLFLNCIPMDMSLNTLMRIGYQRKLVDVELIEGFCFSCGDDNYLYFLPEKKVLAPKEPTLEDFSIGDRVVLLSPAHNIPRYLVGKEGRIVSKGTFCLLRIMFDGSSEVWGTEPKYLRKIEDNALKQVESIPEWQLSGYYNSRKPEYVPFDLSREEDRQLLRDTWIKSNYNGNEAMISAFRHDETSGWQAYIPHTGMRDGEQLFNNYTFIDGSVIGKQIASK